MVLQLNLLASALLPTNFVLLKWMFCVPFACVAGGILEIVYIVPSLIEKLKAIWQVVNLRHVCCSHENVYVALKLLKILFCSHAAMSFSFIVSFALVVVVL